VLTSAAGALEQRRLGGADPRLKKEGDGVACRGRRAVGRKGAGLGQRRQAEGRRKEEGKEGKEKEKEKGEKKKGK
jgi:hypothetical protein